MRATFEECQEYLTSLCGKSMESNAFNKAFTSWLEQHGWTLESFKEEAEEIYKTLTNVPVTINFDN